MKKQIKIILALLVAFIVLNLSCRKNDHPGSSCDQPAIGGYNADVKNENAVKAGANLPAQWYALAHKISTNYTRSKYRTNQRKSLRLYRTRLV